jgi:hypothetical protein
VFASRTFGCYLNPAPNYIDSSRTRQAGRTQGDHTIRRRAHVEISAEEGAAKFGDEFLHRVAFRAARRKQLHEIATNNLWVRDDKFSRNVARSDTLISLCALQHPRFSGSPVTVALGLGFMAGQWRERLRGDVLDLSDAVGTNFFLNRHAETQYCEADYDAAHEAVSAWLRHLQDTQPIEGKYRDPLMNERAIAVDKAIALGQLALLEERRERRDLAGRYWRQAEQEARNASWKDTTEQGIRNVLQRLDNCKNASPKQ